MTYLAAAYSVFAIPQNLSQVYLTKELAFSRESVGVIKTILIPFNLFLPFVTSLFSQERPFALMVNMNIVGTIIYSYCMFALYTFPTEQEAQQSFWNLFHYAVCQIAQDLTGNLRFVTLFAILFKITDKRIAGIHITLMASLTNQCSFMHKFYIWRLVDHFGIFYPQAVITIIGFAVSWKMSTRVRTMDFADMKEWHVSDHVIGVAKPAKYKSSPKKGEEDIDEIEGKKKK